MNTIKCRIRVNEYQDVSGNDVTPAEVLLLRHLHDPTAAREAKKAPKDDQMNFWKCIVNPVAVGVATTVVEPEIPAELDEDGKTVLTKAVPAKTKERDNQEELQRLRSKYHQRAKSNEPGSHVIDDLFPGLDAKLPETFEEIGLEVAPPGTKVRSALGHGSQLAKRREMTTDEMIAELRARGVEIADAPVQTDAPKPKKEAAKKANPQVNDPGKPAGSPA